MYKTSSRSLQRARDQRALQQPGSRGSKGSKMKNVASQDSAQKANFKRAPYFTRLYLATDDKFSDAVPPWLRSEIRGFGGLKHWIRRNAFWQKQIREEYVRIVSSHEVSNSELPYWIKDELVLTGKQAWLNIFGIRKPKIKQKAQSKRRRIIVQNN